MHFGGKIPYNAVQPMYMKYMQQPHLPTCRLSCSNQCAGVVEDKPANRGKVGAHLSSM